MIYTPVEPLQMLSGKMYTSAGYYCRTLKNGRKVIQRCPNREGHVPTEREAANWRRFGATYGTGRKKQS